MIPGRIAGATRHIGAPAGWDKEKEGPCAALSVRDVQTASGNTMSSAWFPTPEELHNLVAGAPVYLTILGEKHPVVMLGVGNMPS